MMSRRADTIDAAGWLTGRWFAEGAGRRVEEARAILRRWML